jgi:hypothetical protein
MIAPSSVPMMLPLPQRGAPPIAATAIASISQRFAQDRFGSAQASDQDLRSQRGQHTGQNKRADLCTLGRRRCRHRRFRPYPAAGFALEAGME